MPSKPKKSRQFKNALHILKTNPWIPLKNLNKKWRPKVRIMTHGQCRFDGKNCRFFVTNVTTEPHVDDPDNYLIFKAANGEPHYLLSFFYIIIIFFFFKKGI